MKLKICGMKYPDNILEVGSLLPDYMGFIFWEKSSRFFDEEIPKIPKTIKKVGVFVDAPLENILAKVEKYKLDVIQLHGKENVEFCAELYSVFKNLKHIQIKVIKVFSVGDEFNFDVLKDFEPVCDYFLFDTKGKLPGGNGTTFNWDILEKYNSKKPFFLSGGIGIEDIEAINKLELPIHAIDVNSKFELEPGLKNVELCKDAINRFSIKK